MQGCSTKQEWDDSIVQRVSRIVARCGKSEAVREAAQLNAERRATTLTFSDSRLYRIDDISITSTGETGSEDGKMYSLKSFRALVVCFCLLVYVATMRSQFPPLPHIRIGGTDITPVGPLPASVTDAANKSAGQVGAAVAGTAAPALVVTNILAGKASLGDTGKSIVDSQSVLVKAVGQAVTDTNTSTTNAAVVAAESIGGKTGKTVMTIITGPNRLVVDFAATLVIQSPDLLQGKLPLERQTLVASPLAAALRSAENQYRDSSRPIPDDVKLVLARAFPRDFLDSARWGIGSISISIPDLISLEKRTFQRADYAVTVGSITIFPFDPGDNYHWWTHELQHQFQYRQRGIDRFALDYVVSCHDIENDAEVKAQEAFPIDVKVDLGC